MAEALAKKLSNRPNIEFVSMGTQPAREVDPKALEVLRQENIIWHGKPKGLQDKEPIDVVVTMGCEVECPVIPGAKRIDWDIPDPRGKDIEDYRKMLGTIKEKVMELLKEVN
jgi:arsenate reductase